MQEVARVFQEDTGVHPSDVFAHIEETPIAAASLAQVHRALTRDGQRVAVKIQYPELQRQARNDLMAVAF
ncbi:AarF/UbiB family protein, partial [Escherichia coli]|nr:AarF/UbiB family protein [Escherichia coli]